MDSAAQPQARWDVFVSYSREHDAGPAMVLAEALEQHGLRVFWDAHGVHPFQPISRTILSELGSSLVLLAYFSRHYPRRRACQHELTTAFLAGQREGDVARRILIVNPERSVEHIHPVQLRDARHARAPRSRRELAQLVEQIVAHVRDIDRPLGGVEPLTPPLWLPAPARPRPAQFLGRLPELWWLHSALRPYDTPLTAAAAGSVAVVAGYPGIGKSALVTEYAHRFAAAFPGGVFWLDADYPDARSALGRQLTAIASIMLGKAVTSSVATDVIATELHQRGATSLWVLDGVRPEIDMRSLRGALGPHPLARSVVTTRSPRHARLGQVLTLDGLPYSDATELLRMPRDSQAGDADAPDAWDVGDLVTQLGGHPAALALIAGRNDLAAIAEAVRADRPSLLAALVPAWLATSADMSADMMDVLRVTAAMSPRPVPMKLLGDVVGDGASEALTRLTEHGVLRVDAGAIAPPVLGHLVRAYDPMPDRYRKLRDRASQAVRSVLSTPVITSADADNAPVSSTGGDAERALAWRLQVELAHRAGELAGPEAPRHLRGALASLYSLVDFTRLLLRQLRPHRADPHSSLAGIAWVLLENYLRPVLVHWHPALRSYESTLTGGDPLMHERLWPQHDELKAKLRGLHKPFVELIGDLAVITGSRYGLPSSPHHPGAR